MRVVFRFSPSSMIHWTHARADIYWQSPTVTWNKVQNTPASTHAPNHSITKLGNAKVELTLISNVPWENLLAKRITWQFVSQKAWKEGFQAMPNQLLTNPLRNLAIHNWAASSSQYFPTHQLSSALKIKKKSKTSFATAILDYWSLLINFIHAIHYIQLIYSLKEAIISCDEW